MKNMSLKAGYWSAILCITSFTIWIICFVGILATSPLFIWTDVEVYLQYVRNNPQFFKYLAQFLMMLFGPFYLILVVSYYSVTDDDKKIFARLGVIFGTAFAVLSSTHYFVQLSYIRFATTSGNKLGIELFSQANPQSLMSAINMLGWTFFFGLSSLFMAQALSENKVLKYSFLANAICCILAGIGFVFQNNLILFIFINLGMGLAVVILSIGSLIYFKKKLKLLA